MAKNTPISDDTTVSGRHLAKVLRISERRVQQLVAEGHLHKVGRGKYPLIQCTDAYIGYLQATAPSTASLPQDLATERAGLVREQRIGQEFKNRQTAGDWAPVYRMEISLSRIGAEVSRLLESARPNLRRLADSLVEKFKDQPALARDLRSMIDQVEEILLEAQNRASAISLDDAGLPSDSK